MPIGKLRGDDPELEYEAERYAAGQMGDQEEREFEVLMLKKPVIASTVELVHQIRAGFRELQSRGELEHLLVRSPALLYALRRRRLQ